MLNTDCINFSTGIRLFFLLKISLYQSFAGKKLVEIFNLNLKTCNFNFFSKVHFNLNFLFSFCELISLYH